MYPTLPTLIALLILIPGAAHAELPRAGEAPDASTSITAILPAMPESAAAPSANVYNVSHAFSPVETRRMLALAVALAVAGILVLEERTLHSILARISPRTRSPYTPTRTLADSALSRPSIMHSIAPR